MAKVGRLPAPTLEGPIRGIAARWIDSQGMASDEHVASGLMIAAVAVLIALLMWLAF